MIPSLLTLVISLLLFLSPFQAMAHHGGVSIGRDEERGKGLRASGGTILYLSPGVRFSIFNANVGLLLKFPVLKDLKEEDEQQGSEGLEKIRAIVTISFAF